MPHGLSGSTNPTNNYQLVFDLGHCDLWHELLGSGFINKTGKELSCNDPQKEQQINIIQ